MALSLLSLTAAAQTTYVWTGNTNNSWQTGSNWTASPGAPTWNATLTNARVSVENGTGNQLIYTANEGTTDLSSGARGLAVGVTNTAGQMTITGGTLSTVGGTSQDFLGQNSVGTLIINGGTYISGTPGIIVGFSGDAGNGTLTVTAGTATISTLQLVGTVNGSIGSTANTKGTVNLDGGVLQIKGSISTGNSAATSTFNFNGGTLQATSTSFSLSGLTHAYVKSGGAIIDTNGNSGMTISQALLTDTVSLGGGFTKKGVGNLILSGANTYTGTTLVSTGTLTAGVASVAGVSGAFGNNSALSVASGAVAAIGNFSTQVGSLTGAGNVTMGTGTLTVGGDSTSASYSGVISTTSTGGLTKIGAGTQALSGVNTYTGATTINGGALELTSTGSLAAGSAVGVNSGAALSGAGTVHGAVKLNAGGMLYSGGTGTVSASGPGTGAVTGTTGGMTLTSTLGVNSAALTFALANTATSTVGSPALSTSYLKVTSTTAGSISFTGSDTLNLVDMTNGGLSLRMNQPYLLISAASNSVFSGLVTMSTTGALSLDGNGMVLGVWAGGTNPLTDYVAFTVNEYDSDGVTQLNSTPSGNGYLTPYLVLNNGDLEVVPEPGTWVLMLAGVGVLVFWKRRKNELR